MNTLAKILVTIGSTISMGFGIWHFFVPGIWEWYSYIDADAKELVLAVRAVNVLFSLSLVLFGLVNLLFAYGDRANRYASAVVLGATCVLWGTRVVLQILYPQGSIGAGLQFGMLSIFIGVTLCYMVALYNVISRP